MPSIVSTNGSASASSVENVPWIGTRKTNRISSRIKQNSTNVSDEVRDHLAEDQLAGADRRHEQLFERAVLLLADDGVGRRA